MRYYNRACYRVLIDSNNNITVTKKDGTVMPTTAPSPCASPSPGYILKSAITTNQETWDPRERTYIRLANFDINQNTTAAWKGSLSGRNGVIYIADNRKDG